MEQSATVVSPQPRLVVIQQTSYNLLACFIYSTTFSQAGAGIVPLPAILPSQKNELLRMLTEEGLSASEFVWEESEVPNEDDSLPVSLTHQVTGFFCRFEATRSNNGRPYTQIEYSPSQEGTIRRQSVESSYAWSEVTRTWVAALKEELNTPDLWSSITTGQNSLLQATTATSENSPFSVQERAQVVQFLGEIRNYIQANAGLSQEKFSVVLEKLTYLEEATSRFGRKDWLNLFLGVLLSTAVQVGMERSVFQDLLSFAGQMLRHFLHQIIILPLPH